MRHADEPRNRRDYLWFASALIIVLMGATYQLALRQSASPEPKPATGLAGARTDNSN